MSKVLNNTVRFYGYGNELTMKFSDREMKDLRYYTIPTRGYDRSKLTYGELYNFSLHAFCSHELRNSSKGGRLAAAFPYHKNERVIWNLEHHFNINQ